MNHALNEALSNLNKIINEENSDYKRRFKKAHQGLLVFEDSFFNLTTIMRGDGNVNDKKFLEEVWAIRKHVDLIERALDNFEKKYIK